MRRTAAWLLLAALAAAPGALPAEEEKPAQDPRLRQALVRSLLFPGLGQLHEKQVLKGVLFASAEVACLALAVVHAGRGNDAYWSYRQAATAGEATRWRAETERCDRRRNRAILAAAGVWVLNMADILVFAKRKYGRQRSLALHPFYDHASHAYGAGLTCRF